MDFKQLQSFAAVVRCRSFSRAAEQLYISQPTISTHIRQLEEECQSRLILRSTKSIEITPRGQELYEYARATLDKQTQLLRRWTLEDQKLIRLGVSTIPADYILPELLPVYQKEHPEIRFDIQQGDSTEILDGILENNFLLGLVGMQSTEHAVITLPFYGDRMVMIAPNAPEYALNDEDPAAFRRYVMEKPVILREQGSGSKKCMDDYLDRQALYPEAMHVAARLNDQESIKKLVAGGFGISFISEKAAMDFANDGRLRVYQLPGNPATRSLYIAYRRDFILRKHIQDFIAFTQNFYSAAASPDATPKALPSEAIS